MAPAQEGGSTLTASPLAPKTPLAPTVPPQHPGRLQQGGIDRPLGRHLLEDAGDGEGGRQGDARGRGVLPAALFHLQKQLENTRKDIQ